MGRVNSDQKYKKQQPGFVLPLDTIFLAIFGYNIALAIFGYNIALAIFGYNIPLAIFGYNIYDPEQNYLSHSKAF